MRRWLVIVVSVAACSDSLEVFPWDSGVLGPASTLSAGWRQTLVVTADGVYGFGGNDAGQLGVDSASAIVATPQRLAGLDEVVELETGGEHSCAHDLAGGVFCWGGNTSGQLGVGDTEPRLTPTVVDLPSAARVLSGGFNSTCALLEDDSTWCWGSDHENQLGRGLDAEVVAAPVATIIPAAAELGVGQGHACAVSVGGELYCWGRNVHGQASFTSPEGRILVPTRLDDDTRWRSVHCGQEYTCALDAESTLTCFGENEFGALGLGTKSLSGRGVVAPAGAWQTVAVNAFHSCGIQHDGTLWCWGSNADGQLGVSLPESLEPAQVGDTGDWLEVSAGRHHTCARRADASVWCTGKNDYGQLGQSDVPSLTSFTRVSAGAP